MTAEQPETDQIRPRISQEDLGNVNRDQNRLTMSASTAIHANKQRIHQRGIGKGKNLMTPRMTGGYACREINGKVSISGD